MAKSILAVLAGIVVGGGVVGIVEYVGHMIYPLPEGLNANDPEALKGYISTAPIGALLFVIVAWALGSLVGGGLATRLAGQSRLLHAMIVGAVLMLFGIANMLMIPHPIWFWALGLAVFLPSAYFGGKLLSPRPA